MYSIANFTLAVQTIVQKAFTNYGVLKGSIISLDRITRCNPAAYYYHLKLNRPYYEKDGRMIDPIEQSSFAKSSKSPTLAAIYSLFIPGFGRAYSNRKWDAIFGASTLFLISNSAYKNFQEDNLFRANILGVASIFIYASEIYGSWRAAKYYQIKRNRADDLIRTGDPFITSEMLYQLSYIG